MTRRRATLVTSLLTLLAMAAPSSVAAQAPLLVRGKVVRQTLDGTRPVAREPVTLHRVNAREAGAID
ncbi:MAG TPA: hypothetical protein VFV33_15385, partial [Gemmatimonadaceae bacterium]|nr:hypothetical protein [Gemmatimonadaceae bacterium]